jgi:hypothetical protein
LIERRHVVGAEKEPVNHYQRVEKRLDEEPEKPTPLQQRDIA